MFEELLISVLFIIVLIILCIISNLYSKREEEKEKYIMLRNSIKEDLKENFISEEEYWQYNKEYSDKIKKIKLPIKNIETNIILNALIQFKNDKLKQGIYTEPIDELILKLNKIY